MATINYHLARINALQIEPKKTNNQNPTERQIALSLLFDIFNFSDKVRNMNKINYVLLGVPSGTLEKITIIRKEFS